MLGRASALLWACLPLLLPAQDPSGLIFGEVTTIDEACYTGVIRWGAEEAFWDDLFIATKARSVGLDYLSGDELKRLYDRQREQRIDWSFMSLWEQPYPDLKHAFRCRFGDIRSLRVMGDQRVLLMLKDGSLLDIAEGPDVGQWVYVYDPDNVPTRVDWDRIHTITFLPTPPQWYKTPVRALYGTVFTTQGAFSGHIIWDDQAGLSTDLLEGKSAKGTLSIPYGDIEELRAEGDGLRVRTFGGKDYLLSGTDETGPNNHGIIVKSLLLGHVRIAWEQFSFARFARENPGTGPAYEAFRPPRLLSGTIRTIDGQALQGHLLYDIDESMDFEVIEGRQDGIYYSIPICNIARIERRNHKFCAVILRNGDKLFLGEEHDVTDDNWGVLVWDGGKRPRYLAWNTLESIEFDP
ncbi:MAG: hypothetical protein OHK0039_10180 [Bacteroidia bacterium]